MILELTKQDVNNLRETIVSIFLEIYDYNHYNEDEFDVECIELSQGELETLIKIAKELLPKSEIEELNSNIDFPEARIR